MRTKEPYLRLYAEPRVIQVLMTLRGIGGVRDLARKSGVPVQTTQRFTSGKMVDVERGNAAKLAETLRVKTDFLFIERRSSVELEDLAA